MRNKFCTTFAIISMVALSMSACSSSQEQPERDGLPSGASSVEESAQRADQQTPPQVEADEMGQPEADAAVLPAQLPASEDCAAGFVTVDDEEVQVRGIRFDRWVNHSMDETTDHFHVFTEPVDCESSVNDAVEAYQLLGHIAVEQFGMRRVTISSGGATDPSAPIRITHDDDDLVEICIEEPITIESPQKGTQVWQGRFQATAYCGSRDVTPN